MKDIKGLSKKWPEMVVKRTIVTTRLGESVFKQVLWNPLHRLRLKDHAVLMDISGQQTSRL